jgi:predicted dehydrogenase
MLSEILTTIDMRKTRIAIIGYGYWSPKLIRNIRNDPELELALICEKNLARHDAIRLAEPGIEVVQEYRHVFSRDDVDAVVIATVPSTHFRIAKQAIEAGKHVLIEKPMTLDVRDGELLVSLARSRSLVLMVDHTYLYSPAIRALRELIHSGELGTPKAIESTRINLGLFQRDTNVIWDLAPHDISVLLSLFLERPYAVSAVGAKTLIHPKQPKGEESVAYLTLRWKTFLAHIHVSWISPVKVRQLTVIGSERMARYDQLASDQLVVFDQGVYPNQEEGESGPLFMYKTGETRPVHVAQGGEDLAAMIADFRSAIRNGTTPISDACLGLDVVRVLAAADRSLRRGVRHERISYKPAHPLRTAFHAAHTRLRHGY